MGGGVEAESVERQEVWTLPSSQRAQACSSESEVMGGVSGRGISRDKEAAFFL